MHENLPRIVTPESLEKAHVAAEAACKPNDLTIVGWLLAEPNFTFRWRYGLIQDARTGEEFFDGTGAAVFRTLIPSPAKMTELLKTLEQDGSGPLRRVAYATGMMMGNEFGTRDFQNRFQFGVGYNVMVAVGDHFKYARFVYAAMTVPVHSDGNIERGA